MARILAMRGLMLILGIAVLTGVASAGSDDPRREAAEQSLNEGFRLAQSGNHSAAVAQYEIGLHILPDSAAGHYYYAESLAALGRTSEAFDQYQTAARLGPSTKEGILAGAKAAHVRSEEFRRLAKATGYWCHYYYDDYTDHYNYISPVFDTDNILISMAYGIVSNGHRYESHTKISDYDTYHGTFSYKESEAVEDDEPLPNVINDKTITIQVIGGHLVLSGYNNDGSSGEFERCHYGIPSK